MQRRDFLTSTCSGVVAASLAANAYAQAAAKADRRVVIGIMGCSRGQGLMVDLMKMENVIVKYVCDPDSSRGAAAAKKANEAGQKAELVEDFRKILDDKEVDALFCAAPNQWPRNHSWM
jgi:predicted dehydrogenase